MILLTNVLGVWVPKLKRYVLIEEDGTEWDGPVAYAKGGGGGTEVVPTGPFGPQIPFIMQLFNEADRLYQQGPPQYPGFSTVAQPNQTLQQSQQGIGDFVAGQQGTNQDAINAAAGAATQNNSVSGAAQPLVPNLQQGIMELLNSGGNPLAQLGQNTAGGAAGAINAATGGVQGPQQGAGGAAGPDPRFNLPGAPQLSGSGINIAPTLQANLSGSGLNPFIEDTIGAATRSLTNNFQRNVIPSIGDNAAGAGQFGGTRHGIAQGIAAGDYQQSVGDVTAQLFAQGFDRNIQAQQQALQQVGQTQAQQGAFGLQGANLAEQIRNNVLGQALQGANLSQQALQGGIGLGQSGVSQGTAQAGNLLQGGESLGQNQFFNALGLIPALQGNQLAQFGALNQSGLQQQGFDQAALDDQVNRFFYEQYAPFNLLSQFQNFIGGSFGSSVGGDPTNLQFPGLNMNLGPNLPQPRPGAQPFPWVPRTGF